MLLNSGRRFARRSTQVLGPVRVRSKIYRTLLVIGAISLMVIAANAHVVGTINDHYFPGSPNPNSRLETWFYAAASGLLLAEAAFLPLLKLFQRWREQRTRDA